MKAIAEMTVIEERINHYRDRKFLCDLIEVRFRGAFVLGSRRLA